MRALDRKLWRDLWHMRGQAVAIALVVLCGVATHVMFLSTLHALRETQAGYYREYRFADLFASLKRAPEPLRERIAALPGVHRVETRVVAPVRVDMPFFGEPVNALMASLPAPGGLNGLHLREGRLPARADEVVVGTPFAEAHGLHPGDRFHALLNGRRQALTLVGTALSPEFIQQLRPGSAFPDNKRYGVMWMERRALAQAYDLEGAFNDLAVGLAPGASAPAVIAGIDGLLERYGGLGAYGRQDQRSHRFLSEELQQLGTLAGLFPAMFMAVAAYLLNVVIGRLVTMQREQVATLKAFGYGNGAILAHYLKLVAAIAAAGIAGGIGLGYWLGGLLAGLYMDFYHFPWLRYTLEPLVVVQAAGASLLAAGVGAWGAVARVLRLQPAQAMRPEPPARYRETLPERLGLKRWMSQPTRMIARNIGRRPLKSALAVVGIALGCGIILTGLFQRDTVGYMLNVQFGMSQREDLALSFTDPTAYRARFDLAALPGVRRVEVFRAVPVRLKSGHLEYRTSIRGLESGGELQRLLDADLRPVALPAEGLLLTDHLGRRLGVKAGDRLVVEVLEGARPRREVVVAGLVKEYLGVSGYMDLAALNALLREGPTLSGAWLGVDRAQLAGLFEHFKGVPRVAGVAERIQEIRAFNKVMDETMLFFTYVATVFAVVIAFGVIYNSARIALTERGRELASLRVLGFTRGEIAYILLGELAVLTLAAIPLGLAAGQWMCHYIASTMQNELFRVPVVLAPQTNAFAVTVVLVSALLSGLAVRSRLDKLDLVAVLKTPE